MFLLLLSFLGWIGLAGVGLGATVFLYYFQSCGIGMGLVKLLLKHAWSG